MREGTLTTLGVVALAAATLFSAPSWVSDLGPIPDAVEYGEGPVTPEACPTPHSTRRWGGRSSGRVSVKVAPVCVSNLVTNRTSTSQRQ
jgi:hypothetical protein